MLLPCDPLVAGQVYLGGERAETHLIDGAALPLAETPP